MAADQRPESSRRFRDLLHPRPLQPPGTQSPYRREHRQRRHEDTGVQGGKEAPRDRQHRELSHISVTPTVHCGDRPSHSFGTIGSRGGHGDRDERHFAPVGPTALPACRPESARPRQIRHRGPGASAIQHLDFTSAPARCCAATGHSWQGRNAPNSAIGHTWEHMRGRAQSLNPFARGFLNTIPPNANWLPRQRCARARVTNTKPATHPLTVTAAHMPEHRVRGSTTKSPAACTCRSHVRTYRCPRCSSQGGDGGEFNNPPRMRTSAQSRTEVESSRARVPNMIPLDANVRLQHYCAPVEADTFPRRLRPPSVRDLHTVSVPPQRSRKIHTLSGLTRQEYP